MTNPIKKAWVAKTNAEKKLQGLGRKLRQRLEKMYQKTPQQKYNFALKAWYEQARGNPPRPEDFGLPKKR